MAADKRILITAGSTWVALDKVRVISNTASGKTGLILAKKLKKAGFMVTLLLGPGENGGLKVKGAKIIRFRYFSELKRLLSFELRKNKYSAVIHAAAVADYKPEKIISRKTGSGLKNWDIRLVPTEKLIDSFKKYSGSLITVGFKFEPNASRNQLIDEGRKLLKRARLDIVVANSLKGGNYLAYIIEEKSEYGPCPGKLGMAARLTDKLRSKLG